MYECWHRPSRADLLVLDAFSGDAIPVHLLTREAFAIYFRHLKPGGLLAVHTSNLHLRLAPVVSMGAGFYGKQSIRIDRQGDQSKRTTMSEWVLIGDASAPVAARLMRLGEPVRKLSALQPRADNYSSIKSILE
jgi:hypothetical protein